jgi:diguanylate cyclase
MRPPSASLEAAFELKRTLRPTDQVLTRRAAQRRSIYVAQAISYVVDAVILLLYYLSGTITIVPSAAYLVCGLIATSVVLLLSEIHFNDLFKDHYLTVPQGVLNISIQLGAIYFVPEVGFYFVCIIFIVLGFGALRMSAQQMGLVWTYATVGLAVMFLLSGKAIAMPMSTRTEHALALACFVTALGRCASTGLYGSSLREAMYKGQNELRTAYARIEELAQLDELTGTLNRRYIMKSLDDEIARAQRGLSKFSVAMIDLDHFKRINDEFGHLIGDEVLRTFAITLFANIRSVDKLGRYGGEEFLLIMPDVTRDEACKVLDRLRRLLVESDWSWISESLRVTMSAGVSSGGNDMTAESILAKADAALYRAKDIGRNRVLTG